MAELVLKDASVTVNAVDLSDHVVQVTINTSADLHENTAMGADSKTRIVGLKDWSVDIEWNQDYAASNVDATLFPLVGAAAFTMAIRPTSAVVGATNPNYNGTVLLESYAPITGGVGDSATTSTTFPGTGDLTRATS